MKMSVTLWERVGSNAHPYGSLAVESNNSEVLWKHLSTMLELQYQMNRGASMLERIGDPVYRFCDVQLGNGNKMFFPPELNHQKQLDHGCLGNGSKSRYWFSILFAEVCNG